METTGSTTVNLLAELQTVPDPRGRKGRRYPLAGILRMLLLAALRMLLCMITWPTEMAEGLRCVGLRHLW